MKKILLLILPVLLLTSCITITEDITVNSDGSGSIKVAVNLGKIGSQAANQPSSFDLSIVGKIKEFPKKAEAILKNINGISNIIAVADDEKGIYSIALNFKNSKSLNKGIYKLFGKNKSIFAPDFVKITKHGFKKINMGPMMKKMVTMQEKTDKAFSDLMFPFIDFKSTYNFPTTLKKVSNIKAVLSTDKKTITTKYTLEELIKVDFNFGLKARF